MPTSSLTRAMWGLDSLAALRFEVDETAHRFNGYEVTIKFDPEVLTFEGLQEGDLMVNACPNRFRYLTTTDSTITYSHVLLCAGVSLDGPGVLSIYNFRANAYGVTLVEITSNPDRTFVDAGLWIWLGHPSYPRQVVLHDAIVEISDPNADVGENAGIGRRGGGMLVWPNPIRDAATVLLDVERNVPCGVSVYDSGGCLVRRILQPVVLNGPRSLIWDGRSDSGRRVASGTYYMILTGSRNDIRKKVVLMN